MRSVNPLVSIIIPVYNVEPYLRRCVNSVLLQTYKNFEVILVDDGSTDDSGRICDACQKQDSRVKVIHQPNQSLGAARNAGFKIAEGEYIGFVDSDDYIDLNMIEALLEACLKTDSEIAVCAVNRELLDDTEIILYTTTEEAIYTPQQAIKELCLDQVISFSVCNKLFSKKIIGGEFPVSEVSEDIAFVTDCILNATKIVHIGNQAYYHYCQRHGSLTELSDAFDKKVYSELQQRKKFVKKVKKAFPELGGKANIEMLMFIRYRLNFVYDIQHKLNQTCLHRVLRMTIPYIIQIKFLKNSMYRDCVYMWLALFKLTLKRMFNA